MKHYDFIFAGAGCAGLSMVYHLLNSPLKNSKILLLDPNMGQIPDKTWCYWAEKPLPIHPRNAIHSWNQLSLSSNYDKATHQMENLQYFHLNSRDFFEHIYTFLKSHPNVTHEQNAVNQIVEKENSVEVFTSNDTIYQGNYIFDSRLTDSDHLGSKALKQIFAGWKIETDQNIFDKSTFTMMEWTQSEKGLFDFFYILPYHSKSALIEYTAYSRQDISQENLNAKIKEYLEDKFGGIAYEITFQEKGVIPMTTQIKAPDFSKRIIPIGTKAGWTKASTGYTFHTIQKRAESLVNQLVSGENNIKTEKSPSRFRFYDNILLNIAHRWPHELKGIFEDLFKRNETDLVMKFLGEETSLFQEIKLLSRLRFPIFIKSLMNYEKH